MRIFACQLCGAIDALSGALIDMTGLLEMGVRGTSVRFIHLAPFFVRAAHKGNSGWLAALARCSRYPLAVHTLYAARLTARC